MRRNVTCLPQDDQTNGWSALLPPRIPKPALVGEQRFDWLVVGAGYAGLAAARRLAVQQPGATIAVVEAGRVGENASGRNSGFAIDLPHTTSTSPELLAQGARAIKVGRFAIGELETLIRQHQIACDWEHSGRFHVAVTPKVSSQILGGYAHNLEQWHEEHRWLDRAEIEEQLGTRYYHSAVYTPGTYLMNPAALIRGLADNLPATVTLFEESPVVEFDFAAASPFIATRQGKIRYDRAILATNAFSGAFQVFNNRQIPVLLFASLSKVLDERQCEQLGSSNNWGITPAYSVSGATLRLTRDRRLLIRHGFEYSPSLRGSSEIRAAASKRHAELLRLRFPQLGPIELEHFWMGWLTVSANHAPAFAEFAKNHYGVSCCNGAGIVRHTAAGVLIADVATQQKNELIEDYLSAGTASWLPPRPFRDIGIRLKMKWDIGRGRSEV